MRKRPAQIGRTAGARRSTALPRSSRSSRTSTRKRRGSFRPPPGSSPEAPRWCAACSRTTTRSARWSQTWNATPPAISTPGCRRWVGGWKPTSGPKSGNCSNRCSAPPGSSRPEGRAGEPAGAPTLRRRPPGSGAAPPRSWTAHIDGHATLPASRHTWLVPASGSAAAHIDLGAVVQREDTGSSRGGACGVAPPPATSSLVSSAWFTHWQGPES